MAQSFKLQQPKNRELLGGDLVAQSLAQLGVKTIFGLHGGHLDAFLVGCEMMGIRLIDTRHETVSVQAAEGYSKLSGNLGVCFVTANSGFCNALPGIATAFADRSPVLVITSSPPLRDAETNCLQGFHDQVVLAKPITKFVHRVTNVEEIPRIVSYAARMAQQGVPGPSVVDFPIDILFGPPRMDAIAFGSISEPPSLPPAPNPGAITTLLDWWKTAKRPVIIAGTGALRTAGGQNNLLLQLAEKTSTPVFFSTKASTTKEGIPFDNPLRGGPAPALAILAVTGQEVPDLVILLGARTGFMLGGRSGIVIPDSAKKVQIDIDGGEIGKALPIDLGIVSDASQFALTFLQALSNNPWPSPPQRGTLDADPWVKTCAGLKSFVHHQYTNDAKTNKDDLQLHPYHAINDVFKSLAPLHPVVIVDGGEAGVWSMDLWESAQPTAGMNSTGYLGFLGNGFGYALGAAVAYPDRIIVNMHGDGSAGFHIAELDTYARHRLKILTVVVNNYHWGMSVAGQDIIYSNDDPSRPVSKLSPQCKFETVAEGFGNIGVRIDKEGQLESSAKQVADEMLKDNRPGLINLIVSRYPVTGTTKGMVGRPDNWTGKGDDDVIVVPYYDNVPRAYYASDLERKGWTRKVPSHGAPNGSA